MLHDLTVKQFSKVLTNLSVCLQKAQDFATEHKFEMDVLLNARLAPTQFNLTRQIQIACDTAKLGVARLAGKENDAPKHEDDEATLTQLMTRIESVITYIEGFSKADFSGAAERIISHARWDGKHLTGYEFALEYATPNIYFHVTTAYAILRHNGVPLGKMDYLGELPFKS